jgi:hypothetical protein
MYFIKLSYIQSIKHKLFGEQSLWNKNSDWPCFRPVGNTEKKMSQL